MDDFFKIPVGDVTDQGINWLRDNFSGFFEFISMVMTVMVDGLTTALLAAPPLVAIVLFALLGWVFRSPLFGLVTLLGFLLVLSMEQWDNAMMTVALVLIATLLALVIAIPIGIWAAYSSTVSAIVKPVLDFMQTMPAFVYLIPAVTFFSIGVVPGLFSTIIFALPPGVRLTELGIRGVDRETVEAGQAFGASSGQILRGIQIPLAIPSIMAGVNQVIMLALSMAVIAGMVGADGLGKEVVSSISTLNLAKGVEAGLAVVILAIFLDRLTAALGAPGQYPLSIIALLRKRRLSATAEKPTAHAATK